MSTAGTRSSRGDVYQQAVAFEWAIEMLRDPKIKWLYLDSTSTISNGAALPVDEAAPPLLPHDRWQRVKDDTIALKHWLENR